MAGQACTSRARLTLGIARGCARRDVRLVCNGHELWDIGTLWDIGISWLLGSLPKSSKAAKVGIKGMCSPLASEHIFVGGKQMGLPLTPN